MGEGRRRARRQMRTGRMFESPPRLYLVHELGAPPALSFDYWHTVYNSKHATSPPTLPPCPTVAMARKRPPSPPAEYLFFSFAVSAAKSTPWRQTMKTSHDVQGACGDPPSLHSPPRRVKVRRAGGRQHSSLWRRGGCPPGPVVSRTRTSGQQEHTESCTPAWAESLTPGCPAGLPHSEGVSRT